MWIFEPLDWVSLETTSASPTRHAGKFPLSGFVAADEGASRIALASVDSIVRVRAKHVVCQHFARVHFATVHVGDDEQIALA